MKHKKPCCAKRDADVIVKDIQQIVDKDVVQKHPVVYAESEYICGNPDEQPCKQ